MVSENKEINKKKKNEIFCCFLEEGMGGGGRGGRVLFSCMKTQIQFMF